MAEPTPSPTVLVVDDDESIRSFLSFSLQNEGFTVVEAEDGEKALTALAKGTFSLVLLDIMMPGIDGFGVCEALRKTKSPRDLPVLFVTAYADSRNVKRAADVGAQGLIEKPFIFSELLFQIHEVLNGRFSLPTRLKFAS